MFMKICGVILNYFGYEDTILCVQTLLDQNDLEKIIIVENSASSNELNMLKEFIKNTRQVEILEPSQNLGFSGGVNLAINYVMDSRFDAFLLLNNDTLVPPNIIKCLANGIMDKGFDLAAPIIYCYPEQHKIWAKGYYYNRFAGLIAQHKIPYIPGTIFYLSGCCVLICRKVFEDIGLLDTSFFMYGEDVEFCFRALQRGFRIGIIEKAYIYHKGNVSSQFNSLFYEYHINRCHFLLCNKLSKNKIEQRLSFLIKIFSLAMRALLRSYKYKNLNAFLGYKQAILETANTDFYTPGKQRV